MTRMRVGGPVWSNGTIPEGTVLGRSVGGGVKPLTPAEVATILSTPSASTIGNLLTANQAGATDALSATTGFRVYAGSGTLSSSTAWAANGSRSLALTTAGTGTESVSVSASTAMADRTPVLAGQTYTASAVAYTTAVGETVRIAVNFYTSGGASSSGSASAVVTLTASVAATLSHTLVAPSDAAYASVSVERISGAAGSVVYFDKVGFWVGAGGMWAMPGVPITNTGRRTTHPNTDDVLVEVWDSTQNRWQVAHYDSGWRNIAGLLTADATAKVQTWSTVYLRRVGSRVALLVRATVGTGTAVGTATSFDMLTVPSGFRFTDYPCPGYLSHVSAVGYPCLVDGVAGSGLVRVRPPIGVSGSLWAAGAVNGEVSWATNDAIPASLPGTLVSSAPYN